jgi:uncharacterized protein (TIGR02246 family)
MIHARLFIAFALALAATVSCSQPTGARDPEADKAAIRAFISRAAKLSQAADAAAWVNLFAEGGTYMPPNGPEVTTRAGLQDVAARYFGEFQPRVVITPVEVEVFGDWAFAKTTLKGTLLPRAGGDPVPEPVPIDGKEIAIYRRQQDGGWKLWRLIGNSNRQ